MAEILKGKPVAEKIKEEIQKKINELKRAKIEPTLATVIVGEREDALSYRKMIEKKGRDFGVKILNKEYQEGIDEEALKEEIKILNNQKDIHGILIFQPLPKSLNINRIKYFINPQKDIDGINPINISRIFSKEPEGIPPATPQAVIETFDFYNIKLEGKNVVIIGRSLVVGKPLAMLCLHRNATVTITHSKTKNLKEITKRADIVIAALGKKEVITGEYLSPGQIVIDVGINIEKGKMYGDVKIQEAEKIVSKITPVPGGIGSITTTVVFKHLIKAINLQKISKK